MKIVLIPCPIAENTSSEVLSPQILEALKQTKHFLVENVRTARRFISELKLGIQIEDLIFEILDKDTQSKTCLLYTSPSPRDYAASRMPSSA